MAFIQVPTLIERKRYSGGMGGIGTSPVRGYRRQMGAVPVVGRRGPRKKSRSRLGTLSSGAMGSLGDDDVLDTSLDNPFPGSGTLSPSTSGGGSTDFELGTPGATPNLGVGPLTSPFTTSGQLAPSTGSAAASTSTSPWAVVGNIATAVGKIVNPSAYATVYPYAQPATSPIIPLLLLGGGVFVVAMLMKK